ncbi:hypothetical protein [Neobacillus thermocopriae]|uniref:Uncharacterized protein n=1 Tax=Neobacillus thermocopriae TaxID=1215031 RepID=A0A6B3TMP1_9BACI|nr:hypothetical protein [Neobacillus thermocopriae]MED3624299.1 hypothetical protein [Neobacillus thermocopriae]MED3713506.1 hypothetical protein [Neobacillus thermocopriae]NEX77616.1 hypothetical protein [Neobacillus thermocopriae]
MNAMQEKLFLELRQNKKEIEQSLANKNEKDWLTDILKEELRDIEVALRKLKEGNFGQCEISGELLPEKLLTMIPTLRSKRDFAFLEHFWKKSIPLS